MNELLSSKNHHLKRLRKLVQQRKARSAERVFVVEGPVLVAEVLASDVEVTDVFVGLESNEDASEFHHILAAARSEDTPVRYCRAHGLVSALDTVSPRPVAAVVVQPDYELDDIDLSRPVLVLVDVRDPGNVGTLARTAEASGCSGVIVAGTSADVWSPKVVRAAAGSIFRLPTMVEPDVVSVLAALEQQGRMVAATVLSESATNYESVDLTQAAIVIGNEAHGLSPQALSACTHQITIALDGPTESLNAATAGAVVCFEALRQRREQ